jgi:acyl-coenzyme A thioesterase PaaI-like protein
VKLLIEARDAGRGRDVQRVLDQIPYARFLGVAVDVKGHELTTVLPFGHHLIGNANLPASHGGALGAFLEITALIQLIYDTACERLPKTVDVSIDYLRSAGPLPSYGRAIVTRRGRRVANVRAEIWQEERARPVAAAHGHFLLTPL